MDENKDCGNNGYEVRETTDSSTEYKTTAPIPPAASAYSHTPPVTPSPVPVQRNFNPYTGQPETHNPYQSPVYQAPAVSAHTSYYSETVKPNKKQSKFLAKSAVAVCMALVLGLGGGGGYALVQNLVGNRNAQVAASSAPEKQAPPETPTVTKQATAANPNAPVTTGTPNVSANGVVTSYSDIIKAVEPSVVTITCKSTGQQQNGFFPFYGDMTSAGSGILFHETDTKYYIATNAHVVSGVTSLSVSISDSKPIPASLVDEDISNDLAVISVAKNDVAAAEVKQVMLARFGDSEEVNVGDVVLAIGNALGEGNTATVGIISAKDKTITVEGNTLSVMQTDAAINPGNSGGPLINLKGEVIGINSAKISQSTAEGMGYSIPSSIGKPIFEDLLNVIDRPYLGIKGGTITEEMAKQYSLPSVGVYVSEVVSESPADKAGLQPNDIITSMNESPIMSFEQLTEFLTNSKIGDKVQVKIYRDGKSSMTLELMLGQR